MQYSMINRMIMETYARGNIKSFPFDCEYIIKELGYNLYKYSELSEEKRNSCFLVSDESLKLFDNIYYNDSMLPLRIRFSLAHELGHIVLDHGDYRDEEKEAEANYFASHFLAPRMAIHYSGCKNQNDVAKRFQISQESAQYAFDDYRRWHRRTVIHKMTDFDKAMYAYFYNEDAKCFVYNVKSCEDCGAEVYNSYCTLCTECRAKINTRLLCQAPTEDLLIAEGQWLYGGL